MLKDLVQQSDLTQALKPSLRKTQSSALPVALAHWDKLQNVSPSLGGHQEYHTLDVGWAVNGDKTNKLSTTLYMW